MKVFESLLGIADREVTVLPVLDEDRANLPGGVPGVSSADPPPLSQV